VGLHPLFGVPFRSDYCHHHHRHPGHCCNPRANRYCWQAKGHWDTAWQRTDRHRHCCWLVVAVAAANSWETCFGIDLGFGELKRRVVAAVAAVIVAASFPLGFVDEIVDEWVAFPEDLLRLVVAVSSVAIVEMAVALVVPLAAADIVEDIAAVEQGVAVAFATIVEFVGLAVVERMALAVVPDTVAAGAFAIAAIHPLRHCWCW